MALAMQPTLGELRQRVLRACGISTDAEDPTYISPLVDDRIRQAQDLLVSQYPWLVSFVEREVPLFVDVSDYDIPDDCAPARIQAVGIRHRENKEVHALAPGSALRDRHIWQTADRPQRYEIIDQVLRIYPAPKNDTFDALLMQYYQAPSPLTDDSHRVVVDGTAVALLAEALMRQQLNIGDYKYIHAQAMAYIAALRSQQSNGSGLLLGGPRSFRGYVVQRPISREWRPW